MNEQPIPPSEPTKRDRFRARFDTLRVPRNSYGMVGPAELAALGGALLMLVLVIVAYLSFLAPARYRLANLQLERSRLQTQLRNSQDVVQQGQTVETAVQDIAQSLDAFENNQLVGATRGRMSLYDSLNALIRKNGVRNTSGPTYATLEPTGAKTATGGARAANTKWQSIYPGIAISVTLEGPYQNLRRFIRDVESSKQFVIINSIELERSTETGGGGDPSVPPATRGSLVSLRVDMATYFQRTATEAAAAQPGAN